MPFFNPMRDYYHRRQANNLSDLGEYLQVVIEQAEPRRGNLVFPGSDTARIEYEGRPIGDVHYCVSPLGDRLYINMIQIYPVHRFRGLALATLWRLWQQHQVPIVPLYPLGDSTFFWVHARRRLAAAGALIEAPLSLCKMRDKERWAERGHECSIRRSEDWVASESAALRATEPNIL